MQKQLDDAAEAAAKTEAEKQAEEEQRVGSRACEYFSLSRACARTAPSAASCASASVAGRTDGRQCGVGMVKQREEARLKAEAKEAERKAQEEEAAAAAAVAAGGDDDEPEYE